MEANQEVPEAVAESQAVEELPTPEQPKPAEVEEKPSEPTESPQNPLETGEAQTKTSEPEKAPEVEPAEAKASPQPAQVTENVDAAADQVKPEVEKPPQKPAEGETKTENEVVEQKTTEQVEKKPEVAEKSADQSEQKLEGKSAGEVEATAATAAKEVEKAGAPETEPEKPSEAEQVPAELPKEAELPFFYGWFLLSEVEERIKCSTMDFLKILDTLEAFKKHLNEFTGEAEKEVDLEQYFQTKEPLHCTTKFCDYGKVEGSKEYAELQVVKDSYGNSAELSVVGLMVTPRTFGARVELTSEQLQLWPAGADKEGVPETSLAGVEALPVGSRAHVTLGCAAGVEAVQTGLDLLEILVLQQEHHEASAVEELELGTLSYLGQGRWYLSLREAVTCDTTFSSFSEDKPPAEPAKKEGGEKKKKPKCSIL
ncbi:2',3'-cyclic-nucleotide 3'-phosphodiesterase [Pygocentrus nattereri]|uniref:Cyclic nucleotide phosphodiesterase catalytic domain-containing protein n=1 Tax=Pygocentrus nattereri TaxID=42514 RepID=A0A3B4DFT0_PYGNA|nr:2',3'-cyclic-nucleotide 3'-phosphodiesterase [Pygocentrus nattereri]